MTEKRTIKRRHLIYFLQVFEQETDKLVGFLVNVTTQGIMIMSEAAIEANRVFHLKIRLQSDFADREYLVFKALSKWSKQSENTLFYDTGFELLDVDHDSFSGIEKIISKLGIGE